MKATNTVDSIALAEYLLARSGPMPHLKLQKLAYYCQAWHLAILSEPLIDDDFQAWVHGPVSRKIWDKFKDSVSTLMAPLSLDKARRPRVLASFPGTLTNSQGELLNDVLKEYGDKSAYHLECLTHSERPWIDARKGLGIADKSEKVIPKKAMAAFYLARVNV